MLYYFFRIWIKYIYYINYDGYNQDLIARGKTLPDVPTNQWSPDEVGLLPYSSGTTGLPKGVMLSHRNIVSNQEMLKRSLDDGMMVPADGKTFL